MSCCFGLLHLEAFHLTYSTTKNSYLSNDYTCFLTCIISIGVVNKPFHIFSITLQIKALPILVPPAVPLTEPVLVQRRVIEVKLRKVQPRMTEVQRRLLWEGRLTIHLPPLLDKLSYNNTQIHIAKSLKLLRCKYTNSIILTIVIDYQYFFLISKHVDMVR